MRRRQTGLAGLKSINPLKMTVAITVSVIIRAAEVIAAMGADQRAFVAGEAVGAGGADLAVVVDRQFLGSLGGEGACRTTL